LGSDLIHAQREALSGRQAERVYERLREQVTGLLRQTIRPEFLNRIDEILLFRPLTEAHLRAIVDIQLRQISERLAHQDIFFDIDDRAKELILREGYDPGFGARPMKRALQHLLLDPMSEEILAGRITAGDKLRIACADNHLTFS
jgi:ATP-dependent Clp protease ATP-binding subunit ClpB